MTFQITLVATVEGWSARCAELFGCHSQGATEQEAIANTGGAIRLWLEVQAKELSRG